MDGNRIEQRYAEAIDAPDLWPPLIKKIMNHADDGVPLAAVSVRPETEEAFRGSLSASVHVVGRDLPIPIENLTRTPETTGHDRLLSGFAASRIYGAPVIVVDFGTAFTFNAIDEDGAFLGGAIAPGLGMAESMLSKRCALLPEVPRPEGTVPVIGRDTQEAMQSGLYNGYLGYVKNMILEMREAHGRKCPVIATGGDASYFLTHLAPLFDEHDPDLLLKGVGLAYTGHANESDNP